MMDSIRQVEEEFFKLFTDLQMDGKPIHFRFARKSSRDYVEEQPQQIYPCIAVQGYSPTLKEGWYIDLREYIGGCSFDGERAMSFRSPLWLTFRFDVSIVSKRYTEYTFMRDLFLAKFIHHPYVLLNKEVIGGFDVGESVPLDIRVTDIPRTDGVFETNYEFSCHVWVNPSDPKEVELVKQIIINVNQKGYEKN